LIEINSFPLPRVAGEVDISITGGEAYRSGCVSRVSVHDTYDILQPDGIIGGGILTVSRIGTGCWIPENGVAKAEDHFAFQCIQGGPSLLLGRRGGVMPIPANLRRSLR